MSRPPKQIEPENKQPLRFVTDLCILKITTMKKTALITGASAGMGKEIAKLLAQNGFTVYGAARRVEKMEDLLSLGIKVIKMDVTDDDSIKNGISEIIKNEGRIDVLINNAGFGLYGAVEEVSMKDARYQLEVNVIGLARLCQLTIPHMRKQHSGKIVNITSIGGKIASPMGGWYHASKFAVEALSDNMRMELKPFGIDVIVIEPGGVKTEWGGIAMDNLVKTSGIGPYKNTAEKMNAMSKKFESRYPEPSVISELVLKAITANKPKTRYHAGFMATPILLAKKILSDRQFDSMMMSQVK
jgi:short-subunit dehydrogenase